LPYQVKALFDIDPWRIIQHGFDPALQEAAESMFALGNGRFGHRANHEETYTGASLQGHYVGGVFYPDKTKVGWWKNGYPAFFAKVLNAPNWSSIDVKINGELLDLNVHPPTAFYRELDMRTGLLTRRFEVEVGGAKIRVCSERFVSMKVAELACIRYTVETLNVPQPDIELKPIIDCNVRNADSNYDEKFWDVLHEDLRTTTGATATLCSTRKTDFGVATAMACNEVIDSASSTTVLTKSVAIVRDLDEDRSQLLEIARSMANAGLEQGWESSLAQHVEAWSEIWRQGDIEIVGDDRSQQAIRFNIFHLNQTYRGDDPRLNIGPKGFTGEKYGGAAYWDTEAYCLPFFLSTHTGSIARQLLVYRRNHLEAAIENAEKLGFSGGAALYPMVTMDGQECHNEWEITFEEIHRNGAMVFAIFNYIRHTGDHGYLAEGGYEVVLAVARFWAQRVNWSEIKQAFVMLGVTGPNEYENNVNNNWYTNYLASWCLKYAQEAHGWMLQNEPDILAELEHTWAFDSEIEHSHWQAITQDMYFPKLEGTRVFLQQEGYMDKVQILAEELPEAQRPINQHWSWDRILRSSLMKQADVLQGLYLFEDAFDSETLKENFEFHEPRTVHESSLSPCVHAVLAAAINKPEKAYEMYLRTARLDLDDYNKEVHEGLHITSMAGTWMSVVEGFGGLRVRNDMLHLSPILPQAWTRYSFHIQFRGRSLRVDVSHDGATVKRVKGDPLQLILLNQAISC
jgi:maltose phosphorylase